MYFFEDDRLRDEVLCQKCFGREEIRNGVA